MPKPIGPRVVAVQSHEDYTLTLTFTNGEIKKYDMKPWIERGGVFRQLKNKGYFSCVKIDGGTIQWPNEQDLCPDMLYLDSVSV